MPFIVSAPVEAPDDQPYHRRWWALAVLCLSLLTITMANTSLIVAAADMTRDLDLSSRDLQWVVDAYVVPFAALMLVFGMLGDKYSRRGALIVGLLAFGAGGVAGSLVDSTAGVIATRTEMGISAAVVMPATLSLLTATFPRAERARAIAAWTATAGLSIVLGPLLAGLLLERYSWSATFLINVPFVVVSIVAALALVPPSKAPHSSRVDLVGGLLSIVSLAALVYMIIEGPQFGWGPGAVSAAVIAGVGLTCFAGWELRQSRPILDVRRFRQRGFTGSAIAVALFFLGGFGGIYCLALHLQFVLGYDPLDTGVRLLPLAAAVTAGALVTARLSPVLGTKIMVTGGLLLASVGLFLLARVDDGSGYGTFVGPLVVTGFAVGLSVAPCTATIMGNFPEADLGVGGGVNNTSLQVGGALGIAIFGSLLATSYESDLGSSAVAQQLPGQAMDVAKESIGTAQAVAQQVGATAGPQAAQALVRAADHAFNQAMSHTASIGGVILAVGAVVVAIILPRRRSAADQRRPGGGEQLGESQPAVRAGN